MFSLTSFLIIVFGVVCIVGYALCRTPRRSWDADGPAPDPAAKPVREPWEQRIW